MTRTAHYLCLAKAFGRTGLRSLWLKSHGKSERELIPVFRAFFKSQVDDIKSRARKLAKHNVHAESLADLLFDPDEWGDEIRKAVRPTVTKIVYRGAYQEWELFRPRRQREFNSFAKDAPARPQTPDLFRPPGALPIPDDVQKKIDEEVEHLLSEDYWDGINATTKLDIVNAIHDGIEAGRSGKEMADDIESILGPLNWEGRADNISRTESTMALNEGHQEVRDFLQDKGVIKEKEWLAIEDHTTRETHSDADGQVVNNDDQFEVGGYKCDYPGDADLPPEERCNCRCSAISVASDEGLDEPAGGDVLGEGEGAAARVEAKVFCPTGPGGGVDPTCSPGGGGSSSEKGEHFQRLAKHFDEALSKSKLPDDKQSAYRTGLHDVMSRMPENVLSKMSTESQESHGVIDRNLSNTTFHDNTDELSRDFFNTTGVEPRKGDTILGAYYPQSRTLSLNGGKTYDAMQGTYAHEFGHVIDGPRQFYSRSKDWREAYQSEIAKGKLSAYAKTNAQEGFAEFSRALYGSNASHDSLASKFPKCYNFWKSRDLLPPSDKSIAVRKSDSSHALPELFLIAISVPGGLVGDAAREPIGKSNDCHDEQGRFCSDGGGSGSGSGDDLPHHDTASANVGKWLASSGVSGEQAEAYHAAADRVFSGMSPGAVQRFNSNVDSIQFHDSVAGVKSAYEKETGARLIESTQVGGFFAHDGANGDLHLDGDKEYASGRDPGAGPGTIGQIYAHEFSHAIDGGLSSTDEWRDIWKNEVSGPRGGFVPSKQAKINEREGFAEFGRFVALQPDDAEKFWPRAWDYWSKNGLTKGGGKAVFSRRWNGVSKRWEPTGKPRLPEIFDGVVGNDNVWGDILITDDKKSVRMPAIVSRYTFKNPDPILNGNVPTRSVPDRLIEVPDVRQPDHYSCGSACANSVGLYLGVGPKTLADWKYILHTTIEQSTRPAEIEAAFRVLGCNVEARGGLSLADLENYWRRDMPVICPVQDYGPSLPAQAKFAYGHYLVFIGGPALGYLYFQDPSEDNVIADSGSIQQPGRIIIHPDDFLRCWHDVDIANNKYIRYGIAVGRPAA